MSSRVDVHDVVAFLQQFPILKKPSTRRIRTWLGRVAKFLEGQKGYIRFEIYGSTF